MATEYRFTIPCTMPLPPPLPPHNLLGPREIVVINSNSTTCKTAASASRGTTGDHRLFAHRHASENRTFNSRSVPGRIFVLLFRLGRETKKKKKKNDEICSPQSRASHWNSQFPSRDASLPSYSPASSFMLHTRSHQI